MATAFEFGDKVTDFADTLHLVWSLHCDGLVSFDRKSVKATKTAGYVGVLEV
jgi:hypothetical protein